MATRNAFVVSGLGDLNKAFRLAGKESSLELRVSLQRIVKPVRVGAEARALTSIRRMSESPKWAGMRTGVTRHSAYVAPKQKGVCGRGPRRRKNLAPLLLNRAMLPAFDANRGVVRHELDRMLDEVGRKWENA